MTEHYFTQPAWGHTLHGHTFAEAKAPSIWTWFLDKFQGAYRGSAMCHSRQQPEVGDYATWKTGWGTVRAPIYKVEDCRDPKDMHTIFLRVTDDCRTPK